MEIDPTTNLLFNMASGLLPEHLSNREIKMLEEKFGRDWFHELGYNESEYKNPTNNQNL